MEILFLKPVLKQMIWGGNRMRREFGYELPEEQTGEAWAVSAHPAGDCRVEVRRRPAADTAEDESSSGSDALQDRLLSELWRDRRELFGNMEGEVFPLLTKIIDAAADLSIQVHPDNEYARIHEGGALGKTECWYILDCEPDTTIIIGHHAGDKEELRRLIEEERFRDLIREIPVHPGDFFQIEPGCVHAIKGGTLLLETQQSSDITYRLYDYGRLQNGRPRELHLEKSQDVITCPMSEPASQRRMTYETGNGSFVEHLVTCPYYTVERIGVRGSLTLDEIRDAGATPVPSAGNAGQGQPYFDIFSVIAGEGSLDGQPLKKGDHFILPHGYGRRKGTGTAPDPRPAVFRGGEMELIHATP